MRGQGSLDDEPARPIRQRAAERADHVHGPGHDRRIAAADVLTDRPGRAHRQVGEFEVAFCDVNSRRSNGPSATSLPLHDRDASAEAGQIPGWKTESRHGIQASTRRHAASGQGVDSILPGDAAGTSVFENSTSRVFRNATGGAALACGLPAEWRWHIAPKTAARRSVEL